LDGLQAVVDMRDGAVEDDVGGVVEEPVAVSLRERGLLVLDFLAGLAPGGSGLGDDRRGSGRERWVGGRRKRRGLGRRRHGRRRGDGLVAAQGQLGLVGVLGGFLLGHRRAGE